MAEIFAMDWGDKGGACWECWKVEPCCATAGDAVYCCLCWYFCGLCTVSKLYAFSLKQDCAIVNHFCYVCFCGLCALTCTRHNLRKELNIGNTTDITGWVGDALCMYCCTACNYCQMCRAVPKEGWDWLDSNSKIKLMESPCIFCL